jgi:hypothetical protein
MPEQITPTPAPPSKDQKLSVADRVAKTVEESQKKLQELQDKLVKGKGLSEKELEWMLQVVVANAELVRKLVDMSTKSDPDDASSKSRKGFLSSIEEKALLIKEAAAERILPKNSGLVYFLKRMRRRFERTCELFSEHEKMTEHRAVSNLFRAAGLEEIKTEAAFRAALDKLDANRDSNLRVEQIITSPDELADLRAIVTFLTQKQGFALDPNRVRTDLLFDVFGEKEKNRKEKADKLSAYSNKVIAEDHKIDVHALESYLERNIVGGKDGKQPLFQSVFYRETPAAPEQLVATPKAQSADKYQTATAKIEPSTDSAEVRAQIISEVKKLFNETKAATARECTDFDEHDLIAIINIISKYLDPREDNVTQTAADLQSVYSKEALKMAIAKLKAISKLKAFSSTYAKDERVLELMKKLKNS